MSDSNNDNQMPKDHKLLNDSKLPIMTDTYTDSMKLQLPKADKTIMTAKEPVPTALESKESDGAANKQTVSSARTANAEEGSTKKARRRFPLWLRIILKIMRVLLVPVLCILALYVGLLIGYVKIGGQNASDVLKMETWKHLYDLVFAQ